MRMKTLKLIEVKNKSQMIVDIQDVVMRDTNSQLISMGIHREVKKFIKALESVPLSEELQ